MNKEMVSFLEKKPVVDYSYASSAEMVFKLIKGYTEVGKVNLKGETKKYNEYNIIIKSIKEAKAFKEYKIIKKQGNKLLGYDENNILAGTFEIMEDNTIYKILPNCKKIDIVDIELENNNIIDRYETIQFEEPIVITTVQDSNKKKRRLFGRK